MHVLSALNAEMATWQGANPDCLLTEPLAQKMPLEGLIAWSVRPADDILCRAPSKAF